MIARVVDADAIGRMSFDDIEYWAVRAIEMRKRSRG
jgi:hypothetical protein